MTWDESRLRIFERVLEATSAGVIVVDAKADDMPIVYVNPGFERITGYRAEEVVGQNCRFLSRGERDQPALDVLRGALARGEACEVLLRNRRKDGSLFWNQLLISPVRDAGGEISNFVAIQSDVTANVEAEAALKKSEERLGAMMKGALDAVYVLECVRDGSGTVVDFTFVDVNEPATRQLSMPAEALLSRSICDVFPINRSHGFFDKYRNVFETRTVLEEEFEVPEGFAAPGWYYHQVVPLSNGVAIINRDITERKVAEEKLRQALREKETLLKELYHRTKNNMMVISSIVSLTELQAADDGTRAAFAGIRNRIDAMSLVHRKLYESQSLSVIPFHEYTEELVRLLTRSHRRDGQHVELRFELSGVELNLEKAIPLGLVLSELVSNAFKHAFVGRERATLSIRLRKDEEGHLELRFADDGPGLPPGFEPSQRGQLGVQTVVKLVEHQLRGRIGWDGSQGMRWTIVVPCPTTGDGRAS